jgi:hypothetical protein
MIYGNATGGFGMPKLIELTDENGNTVIGTVTDSEVALDATRNDVKIGKKFASNDGIGEGVDTKTYRTTHGIKGILPGTTFTIPLDDYDQYDYTKFQAIITEFDTTLFDSTSAVKISLNDSVYNVNSSVKISDVSKNSLTKSIDLNITNDTDNVYVIHYNTYKEE